MESLHQGKDLSLTITRAKFEELNIDLFKKTIAPVKQVDTVILLPYLSPALPTNVTYTGYARC